MSDLVKQARDTAPFSEDGRLLQQIADALEAKPIGDFDCCLGVGHD